MLMNPESLIQADEMTAGNLIQMLLHFDPDKVVCMPRYEGGYEPLKGVRKETLLKNVNCEWYYGPHDSIDSVCDPDSYTKEEFLILTK